MGYTWGMRAWISTAIVCLIVVWGCAGPEAEKPWIEIQLQTDSIDAPYQAVELTEVARHQPPDNMEWPEGAYPIGGTVWRWSDGQPVLTAVDMQMILPFEEAELTEGWTWDADLVTWRMREDSLARQELARGLPQRTLPAIPMLALFSIGSRHFEEIHFALMDFEGVSQTREYEMESGEAVKPHVITAVRLYDPTTFIPDVLPTPIEVNVEEQELNPHVFMASMDRRGAPNLVFETFSMCEFEVSGEVTRLAKNWVRLNFGAGIAIDSESLCPAVEATGGAELTAYQDYPEIYFFSGSLPDESTQCIFITNVETTYALTGLTSTDNPEAPGTPLKVTDRIPAVWWAGDLIVFAQSERSSADTIQVAAIKLHIPYFLDEIEFSVIWEAEMPDIFGNSIVVPVEPDRRPYIVCLDPLTGDTAIFDPLLGSIRCQGRIEYHNPDADRQFASLCVNLDPDPERPILFVHDPGSNEIIELRLDVSEALQGVRIEPIEETAPIE